MCKTAQASPLQCVAVGYVRQTRGVISKADLSETITVARSRLAWLAGQCLLLTIGVVGNAKVADAQQATRQFTVERDNGIDGWENHGGYGDPPEFDKFVETEEFSNAGHWAQIRGRKGNQHAVIMDWDTDAMNAFMAANVDTTQPVTWTLNLYPVAAPNFDIVIESLESLNDWAEGNGPFGDVTGDGNLDDGDAFANFNWEPGTKASTTNFAQTAYSLDDDGDPVLDLENSLPWVDNDDGTLGIDDNQYSILGAGDHFSSGTRVPDIINSEPIIWTDLDDAVTDGTFASVPLDNELVSALLNDPNNRGIVLGPGSGAGFSNWRIHSRESDGAGGLTDEEIGPLAPYLEVSYTPTAGVNGDFNQDGNVDRADIDELTRQAANQNHDPAYDLDGDALVTSSDVDVWIKDVFGSWSGDSNLDGEFNSGDLVEVFTAGLFESGEAAAWSTGDWNGDGFFGSADFVTAFADGGFEQGPRATHAAVPEPAVASTLLAAVLMVLAARRRHA